MSDPYSPYSPQSPQGPHPVGYGGYQQSAGSPGVAKMAAILLLICALVGAALTVLSVVGMFLIPIDEMRAQMNAEQLAQLEQSNIDLATVLQATGACLGACGLVYVVTYLVLTPFVWKNRRGGTITAIVIVSLVTLVLLVMVVLNILSGQVDPIGLGLFLLLVLLQLATLVALVLAARHTGNNDQHMAMQAMSQQAAWQAYYAQQQGQHPGQQFPQPSQLPPGQQDNPPPPPS